jgi:hypothetical protein
MCCASATVGETATRSSLSSPYGIRSSMIEKSAICSRCCKDRSSERGMAVGRGAPREIEPASAKAPLHESPEM